jgi:hypothetical protein
MELIELIVVLRNTLSALLTTSSSWFPNSINHGLLLSTMVSQAIGRSIVLFPTQEVWWPNPLLVP